jgi:hypothetical protein
MNIMHAFLNKELDEEIMVDPRSNIFLQDTKLDELKIPKIEIFPHSMKH